jgi:hypothetical protein
VAGRRWCRWCHGDAFGTMLAWRGRRRREQLWRGRGQRGWRPHYLILLKQHEFIQLCKIPLIRLVPRNPIIDVSQKAVRSEVIRVVAGRGSTAPGQNSPACVLTVHGGLGDLARDLAEEVAWFAEPDVGDAHVLGAEGDGIVGLGSVMSLDLCVEELTNCIQLGCIAWEKWRDVP